MQTTKNSVGLNIGTKGELNNNPNFILGLRLEFWFMNIILEYFNCDF